MGAFPRWYVAEVLGPDAISIHGRVVRILFRNAGDLTTCLKVKAVSGGRPITILGEVLSVAVGDEFTFTGRWEEHPKWGPQFRASWAERKLPRDPEAVVAYLSGGLFPGVGRAVARRIVDHFGPPTLEVLLAEPERVAEVSRLSAKKRRALVVSLHEHRRIQDLALFLQGHGVSLFLTKKIHERYGDYALRVVKENPYQVADEVPGIGFVRADQIARRIGIAPDSPARMRAAVLYVLFEQCETRGHSFLPLRELIRACLAFLNRDGPSVGAGAVEAEVRALIAARRLVEEADLVYLPAAYAAEVDLARRLRALARPAAAPRDGVAAVVHAIESRAGLTYAPEQRHAIESALRSPLVLITGGPGTGKTTITRGVIEAWRQVKPEARILLAAPTGRAAKRMSDLTGEPACTVHRLLEFSPEAGRVQRDEQDPLAGDLLVVDEVSMLDLFMAAALFRAVPPGMNVLLVGDADQLPSVGLGNVIADIVLSGVVPVVRLRHIFRQAQASRIVVNAHRVNQGLMPLLERTPDFVFIPMDDPRQAAERVREIAVRLRGKGRPLDEIHLLTPMRKGEVGVLALNRGLQEALNPSSPDKPELSFGETTLRVGDKVMQIRNNYHKDVYNGDIGFVRAIGRFEEEEGEGREEHDAAGDDELEVLVEFAGRAVVYAREELGQLQLAYASTIHKAQGSEYAGVLMLLLMRQHSVMLQRNLLYTAITRCREKVVVIGEEAALRRAVRSAGSRRRYSRLAARLREREPRS